MREAQAMIQRQYAPAPRQVSVIAAMLSRRYADGLLMPRILLEPSRATGLTSIPLESGSASLVVVRIHGMLGQTDRLSRRRRVSRGELPGHGNAAALGQIEVEKDNVGQELLGNRQGAFGRSDRADFFESACREHEAQGHAELSIMIDNQDAGLEPGSGQPRDR